MIHSLRLGLVVGLLASATAASAQILPSYGEDRAGTSGFQFLEVPVDPRGAALGGTAVATADDASALFWNPALITRGGATQLGLARLQYVADVSMNYAAVAQRLGPFVVGAHIQSLDSGEMLVTDEYSGPGGTGQTFSYLGVSGGLTLGQALSDQFSYGVTAKLVRESAAEVHMDAALLDLGVHYKVGDTGANIGIAIRNFGLNGVASGDLPRQTVDGETVTEDEFEDLVPPTTFLLGMSYDVMAAGDHALTVAGQLTNPNDDAELFNLGAEYVFADLLALRTGYAFGADERSTPTVGFGIHVPGLGDGQGLRIDYGFSQFDRLGATHRIGLTATL